MASSDAWLMDNARGAYNRGRLEFATLRAVAFLPFVAAIFLSCPSPWMAASAVAVLLPLVVALAWRGEGYARGVTRGLWAGGFVVLLPLIVRVSGHACVLGACVPICLAVCTLAGFGAGLILGATAPASDRTRVLGSAAVLVGLMGVPACAFAGAAGIAGMLVAAALAGLPVLLWTASR